MLQNLQPRVHVSPISMIVAVAVPVSPPQHSPMLGHLASSQTVVSCNEKQRQLRGVQTQDCGGRQQSEVEDTSRPLSEPLTLR